LQVRHRPAIRQVEAIKIRLTAVGTADETPWPSSEALKLTGLVLRVGVQPGTYRNLTTAQKQ
jgi:hypothetical protein